jgi:large subunit ribosomal protein L35
MKEIQHAQVEIQPGRGHAFHSHILTKKDQKRKRGLRGTGMIDDSDRKSIKRMLPYA